MIWFLLISAVAASRLLLYHRFSAVKGSPFPVAPWENAYLYSTLVSGFFWGFSAFLLFPPENTEIQSMLILVMASLASSTTISHSSLKYAPAGWATPAILPYAWRCFLEGGIFGYAVDFLSEKTS